MWAELRLGRVGKLNISGKKENTGIGHASGDSFRRTYLNNYNILISRIVCVCVCLTVKLGKAKADLFISKSTEIEN